MPLPVNPENSTHYLVVIIAMEMLVIRWTSTYTQKESNIAPLLSWAYMFLSDLFKEVGCVARSTFIGGPFVFIGPSPYLLRLGYEQCPCLSAFLCRGRVKAFCAFCRGHRTKFVGMFDLFKFWNVGTLMLSGRLHGRYSLRSARIFSFLNFCNLFVFVVERSVHGIPFSRSSIRLVSSPRSSWILLSNLHETYLLLGLHFLVVGFGVKRLRGRQELFAKI
ncbi:hypothetical protein Ahy_A10g049466 isoform A [Arachis hypogaea]|uniref:Uncharacterized protein n=1 Tax=Arachis hypogaea TaxID=3818 RepID=A0A445B776_ARAHY|nr:hypothetical protein Ahy_A10g049466 isoform A [Arachis hypogaea]